MSTRSLAKPLAAVCALSAVLGGSVLGASSQPINFTTIVKSSFGGTPHASHAVIDNATDYLAFFNGHAPAFVDFSKEVVLVVSLGAQPISGYSISITKVTSTASNGAVVHYVERAPGPFTMVYQVITQPVHVVKIAKGPTHFTFVQTDPGVADASYSVDMTSLSTLVPGKATNFDVNIYEGGTKVAKFDPVHGEDMHLILVSQDLADFQHIHPTLQANGTFKTSATLNLAQPYSVFIECQPKTDPNEQVAQTALFPAGAHSAKPTLNLNQAFFGSNTRTIVVDHTSVKLRTAPKAKKLVQAGVTAHVMIEVRDEMGGAANVQDWLGMPGHAIALSPDLSVFYHLHAARGGSGAGSSPSMSGMSGGSSSPTTTGGTSSMGGMPGMGGTSGSGSMGGMPGMGGSSSTTGMGSSSGTHSTGTSSSSGSTHSTGSMSGMPATKYLGSSSDDLSFDLTLPTPGLYKVFFQFQRAGHVVTAPFVVYASP